MKNQFALFLCLCTAFSVLAQAPNANYDPDWDGDGNLGVDDLVGFLALFGDIDTDGDGVWDSVDDCTDLSACNFDSNPTVPCSYDDAIGICGGWCESDENGDGICDFTCGIDSIEYYGDSYATVQIGEQCWFAENLRTEFYQDGIAIPSDLTGTQWAQTESGAVTVYGSGPGGCQDFTPDGDPCDLEWSLDQYGRLYNYHAVADSSGLCPSSWHVPMLAEWNELAQGLGPYNADSLKTSYGWQYNQNGSNSSGFSALPNGWVAPDGWNYEAGHRAIWWTSSTSSPGPIYVDLRVSHHALTSLYQPNWVTGMAVRCLKD